MSDIAMAINTIGLCRHACDIAVDVCVAGDAVGIDHVLGGLAGRGHVVASEIAQKILEPCLGFEGDFGKPIMRRMTVVTGSVGMGAEFVRHSGFVHDMADRAELALVC